MVTTVVLGTLLFFSVFMNLVLRADNVDLHRLLTKSAKDSRNRSPCPYEFCGHKVVNGGKVRQGRYGTEHVPEQCPGCEQWIIWHFGEYRRFEAF